MCRRLCIAASWKARVFCAPITLSIEPSRPCLASAMASTWVLVSGLAASALSPLAVVGALKPWSLYCTSWPIFSSRVICSSKASTRRSISGEASCALGGATALGILPGACPLVPAPLFWAWTPAQANVPASSRAAGRRKQRGDRFMGGLEYGRQRNAGGHENVYTTGVEKQRFRLTGEFPVQPRPHAMPHARPVRSRLAFALLVAGRLVAPASGAAVNPPARTWANPADVDYRYNYD